MSSTVMKAIAFIELVLGVIGSVLAGVNYQDKLDELTKRTSISISETYFNNTAFESGFMLAITWIVGVLILFVILFSIASILEKVEAIEKKQSNDTMWALSTLIDKLKTIEDKQLSKTIQKEISRTYNTDSEAKNSVQKTFCANCNKDLTDDLISTPGLKICPYCDKLIYSKEDETQDDEWTCTNCGNLNPIKSKFCNTCGTWRS